MSFAMIGLAFMAYITQTAVMMNHHQQRTGLRLFYVHVGLLLSVLFTTLMIEMVENSRHFEDARLLGIIGITTFYVVLQFLAPYNKSALKLTKRWLALHWGSILIIMGFASLLATTPIMLLGFGVLVGLSQFAIVWFRLP